MEYLAPPLKCLIMIRTTLENGESVIQGVRKYLSSVSDDFTPIVARWLFEHEQSMAPTVQPMTPQRKVLLEVLRSGLYGQPIHLRLQQLEEDFIRCCDDQISREIDSLPLKLMIPLLLFQFPAYLLLLFGPLLKQFTRSLGS
jgi:hypothetical protein